MADDETVQFPQSDATTGFGVAVRSKAMSGGLQPTGATAALQPGTVIGGRYEILQMLGEGGMGAVYKAMDKAVDRLIALKMIRPDLVGNDAILQRFKQELILARQVTHKNVIRIYDLGEADGLMFITMEYVEGHDLRSLLKDQGKLPVADAVDITIQILAGLQSAHAEGVIHRDLKPGNIMRDPSGRIIVMDFGLARTLGGDGMTQTGMMLGTIEYMSPEQAQAKELDARSDLFTVGLIFYELITGATPFKAESALASLVKRTQERAVAASTVEPTVDRRVSAMIAKCLEREPADRYQSAQQIIDDLENWKAGKAAGSLAFPSLGTWGRDIRWEWIAIGVAVVVLAVAGFLLRGVISKSPARTGVATPAGPEVSLAILPFRNASGDASLDWLGPSLAEMLTTDVGQSAHLRTVSANRLHQIFGDLKISAETALDPATIKRVAGFSNADRVVWGQYAKFGDTIRIDATLQDLKNDRTMPLKVDVASEKEIPGAIDKLAESIRQNLSLSQDLLKELKASSFQPSSTSVEALRDYNQGVILQRDGNDLDAQKQFEAATKADPAFGLAFSRLAQTYSTLGYDSEAEQAARKAVDQSDNVPQAEKYLIAAIRAQVTKNYPEAIKAYENLAKASPDNSDVQSALAGLYEQTGDFTKAGEYYQKILTANPKDVTAVLATGRLAIKSGNPQGSLDSLNRALSLTIQLDNQEQKATALHLTGVAYRMLNRPDEALRNYQEALAIRRRLGQKRGIALTLNEVGKIQAQQGNAKAAEASLKEALQIRRDIGDHRGIGDSLLDLGNLYDDRGDHEQALKMYKESLQIERDLGNETLQAVCLNNIGFTYSGRGQYDEALTFIQQALQLREKAKVPQDIAESVHNVAELDTRMGQYDDAIKSYMRALELYRGVDDARGAAIESYSMGILFGYQGRFGAAVNAKQEALKAFQGLKDKSFWMAEISGGYGESLAQAGRGDEAKSPLETALSLSRELKNESEVAQTLGFQGDAAYYRGDMKSAGALYDQALQSATRSKDSEKILIAKIQQARLEVHEGRGKTAIPKLRILMQQTEDAGLKNLAVECSIYMAEAMIQGHDNSQASQELQRALSRADKLGLQPLSARAHYLLATLPGAGSDAQGHYREVLRLLDSMKKDPGAEKLLDRSDFKAMYEAATGGAKA